MKGKASIPATEIRCAATIRTSFNLLDISQQCNACAIGIAVQYLRYVDSLKDQPYVDSFFLCVGSLLLACKYYDARRKTRDVINVVFASIYSSEAPLPLQDSEFWAIKDKTFEMEQHILRALKFDIDIDMPFTKLLVILEGIRPLVQSDFEALVHCSWKVANDMWNFSAIHVIPSTQLAVAIIVFSAGILEIEFRHGTKWCQSFGIDDDTVVGICAVLLDYAKSLAAPS